MHQQGLLSALTAVLAAMPAAQAAMYTKKSPVLQLDARSYERLIAKSNHTSIVEFYAPWCGHCQNLKPAYEKAAQNLDGLAKVAAIDCDDEGNKPFCGSMGVQGFPTLKIVRPGKKPGGKPVVEDYQGARTASGITEAVASKINNHVKRVTDQDVDEFLSADGPKAVLLTEKGTTSALLRSIAIDYLGVVSVGQIRTKEKAAVAKFDVDDFPKFVLVPGPGQDPVVYDGELNKKDMVEFLKQVGEPNPDPAPSKKKAGKDKSSSSSKPAEEKKQKKSTSTAAEPEETVETETPQATPESTAPAIIPISPVESHAHLAEQCLQPKSHTCILAFVPSPASEDGEMVITSLSQINTKYIHGHRHVFPFLSVPGDIEGTSSVKTALGLTKDVELVAINARRGWSRHYTGDSFGLESVEAWLDSIRMGEGTKDKLPKEIIVDVSEESAEPTATKESSTEATEATGPEPEEETEPPVVEEEIKHEEL